VRHLGLAEREIGDDQRLQLQGVRSQQCGVRHQDANGSPERGADQGKCS